MIEIRKVVVLMRPMLRNFEMPSLNAKDPSPYKQNVKVATWDFYGSVDPLLFLFFSFLGIGFPLVSEVEVHGWMIFLFDVYCISYGKLVFFLRPSVNLEHQGRYIYKTYGKNELYIVLIRNFWLMISHSFLLHPFYYLPSVLSFCPFSFLFPNFYLNYSVNCPYPCPQFKCTIWEYQSSTTLMLIQLL